MGGVAWYKQNNQAAAPQLLEPPYAWFTEGFDTSNLQEAKALLGVAGGENLKV